MRRSLNVAPPRTAVTVNVPVSVAPSGWLPSPMVTVPVNTVSVTPALSWAATCTAGSMVTPADAVLGVTMKARRGARAPALEPPPLSPPPPANRAPPRAPPRAAGQPTHPQPLQPLGNPPPRPPAYD